MKQYTAQLAESLATGDNNGSPAAGGTESPGVRALAKHLRALGQALERFKFSAFDIELQSGIYVVIGRTVTAERIRFSFSRFLRELFHGVMPRTTLAYTQDPTHLRFTFDEIEGFDMRGRAKRQDSSKMPDPYSVSQILRGAGAYLDNREGATLSGISLRGKWVTVSYETARGQMERAKQDLEYFYDYWVKMYMRRSNRTRLPAASEPTLFVTWEGIQKAHRLTNVPG